MIDRTTRLRWRRRVRRSKRQVEDISVQAEQHLERHFFRRLGKLPGVWRFTVTWLTLMILLIGVSFVQIRALSSYYLTDRPAAGGIYTEGVLGTFTNANPLYATSSVDVSVSRLVFAGLLKLNANNQLVGDLAKSWKVDKTEQNYTIKLKDKLVWHDGQPLTADDIVYTFRVIQNPDAKSPLFASLQDVKIQAIDDKTIEMKLPNPLSSFPYILTTGIVPKHLLEKVPVSQLRSINYNSSPIGAGPFKWSAIDVTGDTTEARQEQIALDPFENYNGGQPKLNKFIIRSFRNEESLLESFKNQELNGVVGISAMPEDLKSNLSIDEHNIPLLSQVLVFFKTTNGVLADVKVRRALAMATDLPILIGKLGYPVAISDEPILKGQIGYNKNQKQVAFNLAAAGKLLDSAGWKLGVDGLRYKKNQPLSFTLTSQNSQDYSRLTKELQKQWRAVGVDLKTVLNNSSDLQIKLSGHDYDALLYGVEIGIDPDVFPYWHSSQADVRSQNRLNFSEYRSKAADTALEAGRTRLDPKLRAVKYQPFLKAWRTDVPAIALYQPNFLYLTRGHLFGFQPANLPNGVSRYANVNNWMILEDKMLK